MDVRESQRVSAQLGGCIEASLSFDAPGQVFTWESVTPQGPKGLVWRTQEPIAVPPGQSRTLRANYTANFSGEFWFPSREGKHVKGTKFLQLQ